MAHINYYRLILAEEAPPGRKMSPIGVRFEKGMARLEKLELHRFACLRLSPADNLVARSPLYKLTPALLDIGNEVTYVYKH